MIQYSWQKKDGFYRLAGLEREILAAFSTRKFYPGFKEDLDFMVDERSRFLKLLKLNIEDLVCPNQTHEIEVYEVFASDRGKGAFCRDETLAQTDALITAERGVILSVLTADCIALFIYDRNKKTVGLAHIGWRGLAKGMVKAVIGKMQESFGTESQDLICAISPAIQGCCYEVKDPVTGYFKNYLIKREDKIYLDLPEIVVKQLKELGVAENSIIDSKICTSCSNDSFFSFRKEQEEADRIISVLSLR